MKLPVRLLLGLSLGLAAPLTPAAAQEGPVIVQARTAGLIGERYDGYIGIVEAASPALRRQVAAINIRRRALYSSLGARRGASPEEVGITAACTLLGQVGVGQYYLLGTGSWQRRRPGQSAPRPEYCGLDLKGS